MYTLEHLDTIDSTNTYLMRRAAGGERGHIAVYADSQTGGRGRHGKSFHSPGSGLYMSLLIPERFPESSAMFLTPMTACAVAKAVEKFFGITLGIKWVNDLFLNGKKICGILTETRFDFSAHELEYAVVGVGINLTAPEGGFPEEIKNVAGVLYVPCDDDTKHRLAEEILKQVEAYLPLLGTDQLTDEYISRSVLIGRQIDIVYADRVEPATVLEINRDCNLVVATADGMKVLSSGEVSIKI